MYIYMAASILYLQEKSPLTRTGDEKKKENENEKALKENKHNTYMRIYI